MKNIMKFLSLAIFAFILSFSLNAQDPPHPDDGSAGGGTGNGGPINGPAGGGAGLAGGIGVLLSLGGAYGGRKVYQGWKKLND